MRAHLAAPSHADAHPEIAELGSVLPAFAEIVPARRATGRAEGPDPGRGRGGPGVEGRGDATDDRGDGRLRRGFHTGAGRRTGHLRGARGAGRVPDGRGNGRPAGPGSSTGTWLLGIAAVLVIAVLGGWNLLLQNDLSAARSYEQNVAAVLDAAAQPGSLTAVLAGEGGTGAGLAAVDSAGNVALAIRNLAPTSGAAVYEAWVIASDGVPVPLGGFQVGKDGTASFRASGLPTASGIVLALTLEPGPGATTPTLPIVSKGVATAAAG